MFYVLRFMFLLQMTLSGTPVSPSNVRLELLLNHDSMRQRCQFLCVLE